MIVFVHKAHESLLRWQHSNTGRLLSPRHYARARESSELFPVAADNDCFQGLHRPRFLAMLQVIEGVPLKFVAVPDIVGDARGTLRQFARWADRVRQAGPVALVAQDGLSGSQVPWDEIDALFIGGTSEFKCSDAAHTLILEARVRRLWTHMGRVNTAQRMRLAKSWGINSIDGTSVSMYTDKLLPERLAQAQAPQQLNLKEHA